MHLHIYTDGGCSGNPGPGGWAYCLLQEQADGSLALLAESWGAEKLTTNNRMELSAVAEALGSIPLKVKEPVDTVTVVTDSQYVQKGMQTWIHSWKRNNWRTSSKEPVKNKDLWETLDDLSSRYAIQWKWVKGHAGNEYNERCDQMTQDAIASLQ